MRRANWLIAIIILGAALPHAPASALDPDRSLAQYKHTRWTAEEGAPAGIRSIEQGRDGYLWIGSETGLYRFDGLSFERITPIRKVQDRASATALLASRDGKMWVGYSSGGIDRYENGSLHDMRLPHTAAYIMELAQTADGAIWAQLGGGFPALARYANGKWEDVGPSWGMPEEYPIAMMVARDGTLWITTLDSLFFLKAGARRFERAVTILDGHAALGEDSAGRIWVADFAGARPAQTTIQFPYPTPPAKRAVETFFDRNDNLWGMTGNNGIFRVSAPHFEGERSRLAAAAKVERFGKADFMSSDNSTSIMEDREGNIWVATSRGLDRFRATAVVVEPLLTTPAPYGDVLLGASDGNVYVGEADQFYRIQAGAKPDRLFAGGEAEAVCEGPQQTVWMVTSQGVFRFKQNILAKFARPQSSQALIDCAVDRHGTLWITSVEGILQQTKSGWQLHTLPPADDGPGSMPVITLRNGTLLVAANSTTFRRVDFPHTYDIDIVGKGSLQDLRTLYEGKTHLLLGGRFGLARLRGSRVDFVKDSVGPVFTDTTGIIETPSGETWTIGTNAVVRMATADLIEAFDDPSISLRRRVFDFRDGLPAFAKADGKRDVVRGGDGRLWFATAAGVVWINPATILQNKLPPPVAVAALKAGGKTYHDPKRIALPSGTSKAQIDFAALSLSVPERVEVRYRLEGEDDAWVDPGMRRQAFYTNLGPGTYRFRVIAANEDGVWNRKGATLEITIPPTFVQSNWFLLIGILGMGGLLWFAFTIRVHQLTAQARSDLNVRVTERERIARELHDTLLQSFQGLVLRFQAVAERIPVDQPLRPIMNQVLDRADEALVEGRDRVRDLRTGNGDLAQTLADVANDARIGSATRFNLTVEGSKRPVNAMVVDEVEHIGAEAIRNAFQHAQATEIEAALTYGPVDLRLDLRDDGIGISGKLAAGGARDGHFGLIGMRERALAIGGTLKISSRQGGGTEIMLSIPARAAYSDARAGWISRLLAPVRKN